MLDQPRRGHSLRSKNDSFWPDFDFKTVPWPEMEPRSHFLGQDKPARFIHGYGVHGI
jgi:hypothetical protein